MLCRLMHVERLVSKMAQIVLTRIDNRLIHGQIVTQWCGHVQADVLLVANDEVAHDSLRQSLMKMAAPQTVETRYFTLAQTIEALNNSTSDKKVAILCETPQDVFTLIEGGVNITTVNVGNMHMSKGKRAVAISVAVDDADVSVFKKIKERGVTLEIQRVPHCAKEKVEPLYA